MKKRDLSVALGIHGMNDKRSGKLTIDRVTAETNVDIVDTDDAEYGYVELTRIWFFKRRFIERIAGGIKKWLEDERIALIFLQVHSNGLNFGLQALKLLRKRGLLNPEIKIIVVSHSGCANRKVNTDDAYEVHNWYTREDGWLKVAKFLPSWTMGSFGLSTYRGKSKNVINKNIENHISSHSLWFKGHTLAKTIEKNNELVEKYKCEFCQ